MAADKGKQFEYAVMLAAYGRINEELTGEVKRTFDTIMRNTNNGQSIDPAVMKAARDTMDRIQPRGDRLDFYKSFRQLGGGAGGGGAGVGAGAGASPPPQPCMKSTASCTAATRTKSLMVILQ